MGHVHTRRCGMVVFTGEFRQMVGVRMVICYQLVRMGLISMICRHAVFQFIMLVAE